MMAELLSYACNMCSYSAGTMENLTSHVCRMHKSDPRFHIYCESCLRSYTKWDSYRKHIQRGCCVVSPTADMSVTNSPPGDDYGNRDEFDTEEQPQSPTASVVVQEDWHEAAYILNIKERYVLSQVAVDQVLACTRTLVSDVLSGVLDDVRADVPSDTVQLLENRVDFINDTLFKHLASAALQKKYFKQHFNLVVSDYSGTSHVFEYRIVGLISTPTII